MQGIIAGIASLALMAGAGFMGFGFGDTDTVVVTPDNMQDWFFYNDENDTVDNTLGSFVAGPGTPPLGSDSVEISVTGTQRRNLATVQFSGTPLADITEWKYSTYNPSAGNGSDATRSAYLNFNVDFDESDTWQRRLAFVPRQNGTVTQDSWQEWDVIQGGNALWWWSGYASNGNTWPDGNTSEYRTWSDLIASFPGIRIRVTDAFVGLRVGEPYTDGYTENIDKFIFSTGSEKTIFDFEQQAPKNDYDCKKDGWKRFGKFRNQGDCESSMHKHRRHIFFKPHSNRGRDNRHETWDKKSFDNDRWSAHGKFGDIEK